MGDIFVGDLDIDDKKVLKKVNAKASQLSVVTTDGLSREAEAAKSLIDHQENLKAFYDTLLTDTPRDMMALATFGEEAIEKMAAVANRITQTMQGDDCNVFREAVSGYYDTMTDVFENNVLTIVQETIQDRIDRAENETVEIQKKKGIFSGLFQKKASQKAQSAQLPPKNNDTKSQDNAHSCIRNALVQMETHKRQLRFAGMKHPIATSRVQTLLDLNSECTNYLTVAIYAGYVLAKDLEEEFQTLINNRGQAGADFQSTEKLKKIQTLHRRIERLTRARNGTLQKELALRNMQITMGTEKESVEKLIEDIIPKVIREFSYAASILDTCHNLHLTEIYQKHVKRDQGDIQRQLSGQSTTQQTALSEDEIQRLKEAKECFETLEEKFSNIAEDKKRMLNDLQEKSQQFIQDTIDDSLSRIEEAKAKGLISEPTGKPAEKNKQVRLTGTNNTGPK